MDERATDEELLALVAERDRGALRVLYLRHEPWLTARLSRCCADRQIVEEVVQDAFVTAWETAGRYAGTGEVAAWLWGIAVRKLLHRLRPRRPLLDRLRAQRHRDVESAEEAVLVGIQHGRLGPALDSLSPELRAVVQATVLDGLTTNRSGRSREPRGDTPGPSGAAGAGADEPPGRRARARQRSDMHTTSLPARARIAVLAGLAVAGVALAACGDDDATVTAAADGPSVAFVSPVDGGAYAGAIPLEMAADGVTIEPAGEVRDGAGHFHVIAGHGCLSEGASIPKDAQHVHFGQGQTEAPLYLPPGEHRLCLQVGDGAHTAVGLTDELTVTVGVQDEAQWCAVAEELDELVEGLDLDTVELADAQAALTGAKALVQQLQDGLGHAGTAADDAGPLLDVFVEMADAVLAAPDAEAAKAAVDAIGADAEGAFEAGSLAVEISCPGVR